RDAPISRHLPVREHDRNGKHQEKRQRAHGSGEHDAPPPCLDQREVGHRDHIAHLLIRGASPLGLPCTRSRPPLRRRAPFAWLTRGARSLGIRVIRRASPLGRPCTRSRPPLRRRAPFAWLTRGARSLGIRVIRRPSPLGCPCTRSRPPLRRRAPFAWLTRGARSLGISRYPGRSSSPITSRKTSSSDLRRG